MYKGNNGSSDAIIKVFHLAHFADGDMGRVQELSKWFYRTVEMQNRVAEKSSYVAPVLLYGIEGEAAWEVTKIYSSSAQKIIDTRSYITQENFGKIIESVVQGALDLKEAYGRSHGNIKASNVLFNGDPKAKLTDVVLSDPAPGDGAQSLQFEANDLRGIGELIYRLVVRRRDEETVPTTATTSPQWPAILGKNADGWLALCNRLLDPGSIGGTYSLERLALDILKLKPSRGRSPAVLIGTAAAAAVVVGAGIFFFKSGKTKTVTQTRTETKIVKVVDTDALRVQQEAAQKSAQEAKRLADEKRVAEERAATEAKARDEALKKAESEAKRLAESARVEERQKAEAEARRLAEEKRIADQRAAAEAKLREEALKKAEAEAKRLAEEKRAAEEKVAKLLADDRKRAEAQAKQLVEEKRLAEEREAKARREADLKAAEVERLRKEADKIRETEQAKAREMALAMLKQQKQAEAAGTKTTDTAATLTPALFKNNAVVKARRGEKWVNSLGMRFVPIGDGKTLLCIWETRRKDFEQFVGSTSSSGNQAWKNVSFPQTATDPVVNVSPADAEAFCVWLTKAEAERGLIESRQFYRLPTNAEWTLASEAPASAEGRLPFVWGHDWPPPSGVGNFPTTFSYDRFDYTAPVAQFRANSKGLYDVFGNVWEICSQAGGRDSYFGRGGSWQTSSPDQMSASFYLPVQSSERREDVGFRCVLDLGH